MKPSRRPAVARGFAAASLATFAALAGHVTGGGAMPGPLGILAPWLLSSMICVLLAGRTLSVARLSISVAVSQFLFHGLFVLGTITPSGQSVPHVHGAPLVLPVSAGVPATAVAAGPMWAGHLLAAVLTVVVAHRGERMLLALRALAIQLVHWARRRVDAVLTAPAPMPVCDLGSAVGTSVALTSRILAPLRGRAPPVVAAI